MARGDEGTSGHRLTRSAGRGTGRRRAQQRYRCIPGGSPLRCGSRCEARRHSGAWWDAVVERCRSEDIGLSACPVSVPRLSPRHYDPSAALVRRLLGRRMSRYDVVHANSPWTGACVTASAIAAVGGARLMITPHEVFTPFDLRRGGSAIRALKRAGMRGYGRVVDKIVCSSRHSRCGTRKVLGCLRGS